MAKEVYLLGAGGHGRVILDTMLANGLRVKGILDSGIKRGGLVFNVPVIGGDEYLDDVSSTESLLINGLGANPLTSSRREIFERMKNKGFSFDSVLHTTVIRGRECMIGEGSQIMAGVVLQNSIHVGSNVVVNTSASIDHDCELGDHAFISPRAVLCGNVVVAESAFVGAGAVILPGIHVGSNAIIGAGAVVTKPVPEGWVVSGNPAIKRMGTD